MWKTSQPLDMRMTSQPYRHMEDQSAIKQTCGRPVSHRHVEDQSAIKQTCGSPVSHTDMWKTSQPLNRHVEDQSAIKQTCGRPVSHTERHGDDQSAVRHADDQSAIQTVTAQESAVERLCTGRDRLTQSALLTASLA